MKKKLMIILTVCLMVTFTACEDKEKKTGDTEKTSIENDLTIQSESNPKTEEKNPDKSRIDLIYTFKDPGKPVVFDYPNLKCIEEATSQIFKNSKYVIVYCRDSKKSDLINIPENLTEDFESATSTHLEGTFKEFNIVTTEEVKINQTDVMKMDGHVLTSYYDGSVNKLPMRGYTFIKDDTICELIAVLSEESNDENQAEMEETIDAMIQTLREER